MLKPPPLFNRIYQLRTNPCVPRRSPLHAEVVGVTKNKKPARKYKSKGMVADPIGYLSRISTKHRDNINLRNHISLEKILKGDGDGKDWDEITAAKILSAPASQDRHIELSDMQRALMHLPQPQREALILVGAGGFAYEEAAAICGCAVGTIKSRVARGRVALEQLLTGGKLPSRREHKTDPGRTALQTIMGQVDELSCDHERG